MNAQPADTTQTWLRDKSECPWVTKIEPWRTQSQGTWKQLSWCNLIELDMIYKESKQNIPKFRCAKLVSPFSRWLLAVTVQLALQWSTEEDLNVYVHILLFLYLNILIQYLTMPKHLNVCQLHSRFIYNRTISFSTLDLNSHPEAVRLNGTTLSFWHRKGELKFAHG